MIINILIQIIIKIVIISIKNLVNQKNYIQIKKYKKKKIKK